MKKIFLFIAFLWISLVSFAQDGVNFEHLSLGSVGQGEE